MTALGISVVIPSRGGRERLPRLLTSIAAQTGLAGPLEVIVVVDGDVDGTEELLRQWPDVRAVVLPENRGRAVALNAGFAAATGDILLRCDDDLELVDAGTLARLAAHHEQGPIGVAGVCVDVYPAGSRYASAYGQAASDLQERRTRSLQPDDTWLNWNAFVSVRREVYDEVGPYDVGYRAYGWEDLDWGYRLHQRGIPILIPPDVTVRHHNPAHSTAQRAVKAFESGAARATFEQKHGHDAIPAVRRSVPFHPWDLAVAAFASAATTSRVERWGTLADRSHARLPRGLAEKASALVVEAAGRAGDRARTRIIATRSQQS